MDTVIIDYDRCIMCGSCVKVCVRGIFDDSGDMIRLDRPEMCILCGHCKAVCPEDAVSIPSTDEEEFIDSPDRGDFISPEDLLSFFRYRRSTRIYKDTAVEKEKIQQIVEAGRYAPTGGNFQALRYVVAHTPDMMDKIRRLAVESLSDYAEVISRKWENKDLPRIKRSVWLNYAENLKEMARLSKKGEDRLLWNAPALVVIHVSKLVENPGVDVGLGAMQMVLMAQALGLGTCFIGFIPMAVENSAELKQLLRIPDGHSTVTSFVTGYPDVSYLRLVSRKPARIRWL